jgi:hypothetical protein
MNLPNMTAAASLYTSARNYRGSFSLESYTEAVTPSQWPTIPIGSLPPGSYQQSCTICEFAPYLGCYCPDFNGNMNFSYFPGSCQADITNCNGELRCGGCDNAVPGGRPVRIPVV